MAQLDAVESTARKAVAAALADLRPGADLVVGVSGGCDSLALAAVAHWVAARLEHSLRAVVVDHGLQPESADVARHATDQLGGLGLKAEVVRVQVGTAGGPEAAARTARMAALTLPGPDAVLLGHTLDDQAETVLLGLGRGSGPRSIAGMRRRAGVVRRPFLGLTRADTQHLCRLHDLTWWDDPHNADPRFRRSRLRTEVMPLLDDVLGGGVVAALGRTAEQLRADVDLLDTLAADAITTDVDGLGPMHPAIRRRVLRTLAHGAGALADELTAAHIHELDRLVVDFRGQQRVELPGHVSCRRVDGHLQFGPTPQPGSPGGVAGVAR